jgi:hypothetical protein
VNQAQSDVIEQIKKSPFYASSKNFDEIVEENEDTNSSAQRVTSRRNKLIDSDDSSNDEDSWNPSMNKI